VVLVCGDVAGRSGFGADYRGHPRLITTWEVATVPNSSVKNEKLYQDLRKQGDSKEKAARISNAAAAEGRSAVGRRGGKSRSYTEWTVPELKKRAKELGMSGYSSLTKDKLISILLNH
jgi:hypothetical protein